MFGVDYSGGPPSPAALKNATVGIGGRPQPLGAVGRYLAPRRSDGSRYSKCLTPRERDALLAVGLDIWLVFEYDVGDALGGAARGHVNGRTAAAEAKLLDWPGGACVYLAVDQDVSDPQLATVMAYLDAARPHLEGIGLRCGVYGEYSVCKTALANGHADLAWQCRAWSGVPSPQLLTGPHGASLYQQADSIQIDGVPCDIDQVWRADYGGYLGASPQPNPHPHPNPTSTVTALQTAVCQSPDGKWGPNTDTALESVRRHTHDRDEQGACGVVADGIWGPVSQAAEAATIRRIQAALNQEPDIDLVVDGLWGPLTDAAFTRVRQQHFMKW